MPPDAQLFQDIAIELGVDPAFIEKDWYAIQVLTAIAVIEPDQIGPVFCGGTCLSKAYGLLKRFSEDLDFRGHFISAKRLPKSVRRDFRESVLAAVETVERIELDRNLVECGGNYFKFPLQYQQDFHAPEGLRPHLQVEFSYTKHGRYGGNYASEDFRLELRKSRVNPRSFEASVAAYGPEFRRRDSFGQ